MKSKALLYPLAVVMPIVVLFGVGLILPPRFEIAEERDVQAPIEMVFEVLDTHAGMAEWALWAADETPGLSGGPVDGPSSGVGTTWRWDLDGEPWGSMKVVREEPPTSIVYEVDYRGRRIERELTLSSAGTTTTIAWAERAEVRKPTHRWLTFFMDDAMKAEIRSSIAAIDVAARARWEQSQAAP